jgi:hypothetical protein
MDVSKSEPFPCFFKASATRATCGELVVNPLKKEAVAGSVTDSSVFRSVLWHEKKHKIKRTENSNNAFVRTGLNFITVWVMF